MKKLWTKLNHWIHERLSFRGYIHNSKVEIKTSYSMPLGDAIDHISDRVLARKRLLMAIFSTVCFSMLGLISFLTYLLLQVMPILKDIQKQQAAMNRFLEQPVVLVKDPPPLGFQPGILVDLMGVKK